ncbi:MULTISPECIES: hypothetical protein [Rahnella]|uniref:Uncharacterized protein n=1 Tax=Rahnella laticis TaxID=2787622 RepID=A0ABS0EA72_9GAMM|nr:MULTISPECIES: hypothetical protein [Rahnella]MBF7981983.1 hypothetical protein [Rahnella laticis]MBF8002073.1 hypothetical protein [Rahnella sp. LAC-M12]
MSSKNDQVFQLSLTEIFIIICFVLLLLMGFQIFQLTHKNQELERKVSLSVDLGEREHAIKVATADLKIQLSLLGVKKTDELITKLIDASKAKEEVSRLKVLLENKDEKITALTSIEKALAEVNGKKNGPEAKQLLLQTIMTYEQLKKLVIDKTDDKDLEPSEVVKRVGELKTEVQTIKDAAGTTEDSFKEQLDEIVKNANAYTSATKNGSNPVVLEKSNKDLRVQVQYLQNRLNSGRGVDLPPCWVNEETGKIEMLFTLSLRENTVSLAPAWPESRQDDAMALPGINNLLANTNLPYNEFMQSVKAINELSKEKECRFYIRLSSMIPDAVTSDRRRLLIETVFYKTEVRR